MAAATACMILMHVTMQLEMWHDLSYGYRDIGLFARALHNAANGQGLWVDSLHRSILGEHAFIGLWLLVPLCKLGADPFLLLILVSSIVLNGSAIIIYWYVKKHFASNVSALMAALAWLLLPWFGCLIFAHSYGFHLIYLTVPLLLLGLLFTELERYRSATVAMLLALTMREDIALTVAAWGLFLFYAKKRRLLGLCTFGASVAYLIIAIYVIVPHYRGGPYPHVHSYLLANPEGRFTRQQVLIAASFFFTLFMPLAGLPLREWKRLCVAVPCLAETVLTTNKELHNICFQYYTPAIAVLFAASIEAWRRRRARDDMYLSQSKDRAATSTTQQMAKSNGVSTRGLRDGWCLLMCALAGQVYLGLGPISNNPATAQSSLGLRSEIPQIEHVRSLISQDTSVTASYRIASHFLDYGRLWLVGDANLGDCVIIDDRDNWDASHPRAALIRAQRLGGYRPLLADYHLIVLVKDEKLTFDSSRFMPTGIPPNFESIVYGLGHGVRLVARRITIGKHLADGERQCRISIIWTSQDSIDVDYRFGLVLERSGTRWGPFFFVRGAYPTVIWTPGKLYRDDVDIVVPENLVAGLQAMKAVLLY